MLIPSPRHRPEDLELWAELEAADLAHAVSGQVLVKLAVRAAWHIQEFARRGPCYCSVSWGKDSVALAHLVCRTVAYHQLPVVPLVWVRVAPIANPDCPLVRDAFLRLHPTVRYEEVVVQCRRDQSGWHATGTLERGFRQACERFGTTRRFAGIRAEESGTRKISLRADGQETTNSCRPLGWWTAADVFAYLAACALPVHPVYAMLGSGRWDRQHLRVSSLTGKRGSGMGRSLWEQEYYGDILRRLSCTPNDFE